MLRMKMKPLGVSYRELFFRSMHNAEEIVARQHVSRMSVFVHNCFALTQPVAIVWHIDLLPKDHRAVTDKYSSLYLSLYI
jgi:hypothetical protein